MDDCATLMVDKDKFDSSLQLSGIEAEAMRLVQLEARARAKTEVALADTEIALADTEIALAHARAESNNLRVELESLKRQHTAILSSASWRITEPMRILVNAWHRLLKTK